MTGGLSNVDFNPTQAARRRQLPTECPRQPQVSRGREGGPRAAVTFFRDVSVDPTLPPGTLDYRPCLAGKQVHTDGGWVILCDVHLGGGPDLDCRFLLIGMVVLGRAMSTWTPGLPAMFWPGNRSRRMGFG